METIAKIYAHLNLIERSMYESTCLHPIKKQALNCTHDMSRFTSAKVTRAVNHIQAARMTAGAICMKLGLMEAYRNTYEGGEDKLDPNTILDGDNKPIYDFVSEAESKNADPEIHAIRRIRSLISAHHVRKGLYYDLLMIRRKLLAEAKDIEDKDETYNLKEYFTYEVNLLIGDVLLELSKANNQLGLQISQLLTNK